MRTTITMGPETRDRVLRLKAALRLPSAEAVILRLLGGGPQGATAIFQASEDAIRRVMQSYGLRRLRAFGSRARGDARPDSDVDLVATFPASASLMDQAGAQLDLEEALGIKVNLLSDRGLPARLRREIERDGVLLAP